jgi:fumarate hydratase, class II
MKKLWGEQTELAIKNFQISGIVFGRLFINALGLIKYHAAQTNMSLGVLDKERATLVMKASKEVADGKWDDEFPVDIFQTGSGTSTHMNANEVIANRAIQLGKGEIEIHPNDHVNMGQSSNDVIPTAMRVSAYMYAEHDLVSSLELLKNTFLKKGKEYKKVVTTGRTHLMDAMPVSFEQRFGGYARQIELSEERIQDSLKRLRNIPLGGTAVGTGINTHKHFARAFALSLSRELGVKFCETDNHFEAQASLGDVLELHGQLKVLAVDIMKISNDLRWMNSGPINGLGEIVLPTLQPGSSIMPGKVNPVLEEAVCMVAMRVIGNDTTITMAAQSGNFELNVALPITAHCLLESIMLLTNVCMDWAKKSISKIVVSKECIEERLNKNPILATALVPYVGYGRVADIIKKFAGGPRSIIDVAQEECHDLSPEEIRKILNPQNLI